MIAPALEPIILKEYDNYLLSEKVIITKDGRALKKHVVDFLGGELTFLEQNPDPSKKFAHLCEPQKHTVAQVIYSDNPQQFGKYLCVVKDGEIVHRY